jgi:hypothetical protein
MKQFSYYGLEVEVKTGGCNIYSSFLKYIAGKIQRSQNPTLFITSEVWNSAVTGGRGRRQTLDFDYCNSLSTKQPKCCLRSFRLNFKKDLGWDWIVQPKTISLNQCLGECEPHWGEDVSHVQIINELRLLNPLGSIAPWYVTQLESIIFRVLRY